MANDTLLTLIAGTLGIDPAAVTEGSDMAITRKWDSLPNSKHISGTNSAIRGC